MGQCFGWSHGGPGRAPPTRTNRRFEYTPKKSWKYKDAHMMTQFQALSMDSEDEGGRQRDGPANQFSVGGLTSGSEDELYEADLSRNSSKLVFSDDNNGGNDDNEEEEEELGQVTTSQPTTYGRMSNTLVNKGFQPLEDQSFDSPRIRRLESSEDRVQLLEDDHLNRDGVT